MEKTTPLNPEQVITRQTITPAAQTHHPKAQQQAHCTLKRVTKSVMVRNAG
jgi:hypothetical protein